MRPAPHPNRDDTHSREDRFVADPFEVDVRWKETARKNREIFTELFRPLPTNLVRDWAAYDVCTLHLHFLYGSLMVFSS
jgi:phospholipase D1/2